MRIRVTTRADLFEKRKQQHIERGYRIEDERPICWLELSSNANFKQIFAPTGNGKMPASLPSGRHRGSRT
jgi:hypothetical protein